MPSAMAARSACSVGMPWLIHRWMVLRLTPMVMAIVSMVAPRVWVVIGSRSWVVFGVAAVVARLRLEPEVDG